MIIYKKGLLEECNKSMPSTHSENVSKKEVDIDR